MRKTPLGTGVDTHTHTPPQSAFLIPQKPRTSRNCDHGSPIPKARASPQAKNLPFQKGEGKAQYPSAPSSPSTMRKHRPPSTAAESWHTTSRDPVVCSQVRCLETLGCRFGGSSRTFWIPGALRFTFLGTIVAYMCRSERDAAAFHGLDMRAWAAMTVTVVVLLVGRWSFELLWVVFLGPGT